MGEFKEWLHREELKQEKIDIQYSNLVEGIDIDNIKKVVKFNNSHEDNTNTSEYFNPTQYKIKDIDVISIFKRKQNTDKNDGNPLIHALKRNYGWKIDDKSVLQLFKQFIKISKKIKDNYNTIISIQSSSSLNNDFLYRLNKIIKSENKITDIFNKLPASEILEKYVDTPNMLEKDAKIIINSLRKMIEKDNYFTYKEIPMNLRKYICNSCTIYGNDILKYSEMINDKDILILDDTISSGETISDNVKAIRDTFSPKSITVITLFSPLSSLSSNV